MIWYALDSKSREVLVEAEGFCNCSDKVGAMFPEQEPGSVAPYFLTTDKDFWKLK